jgi:Mg2+ and Co2+ transporter CorA
MSHDHVLQLQDRLEIVLAQFETEIVNIEQATTGEDLQSVLEAAEHLRTSLVEVKNYFVDVRDQLSDVVGIPPAKELAQLVIGASTEALSAIRETLHYLEDVKDMLKTKRRSPLTREEIHYADFSAKVATRKSRYIINQISEHAEELPQQL